MTEAKALLSHTTDIDAEARWNAWLAKGIEHDRVSSRRALGVAVLLALGLAGWLLVLLR